MDDYCINELDIIYCFERRVKLQKIQFQFCIFCNLRIGHQFFVLQKNNYKPQKYVVLPPSERVTQVNPGQRRSFFSVHYNWPQ